MVTTTSRLAYSDCFDLMDKAIADQKGIRVKFATHDDALNFRLRLHTARRIDREDNTVIYGDGHPMYGKSVYDPLIMRIKGSDGVAWLRLERVDTREFEYESLAEPAKEPELPISQPSRSMIIDKDAMPRMVEVKPIMRRRM